MRVRVRNQRIQWHQREKKIHNMRECEKAQKVEKGIKEQLDSDPSNRGVEKYHLLL